MNKFSLFFVSVFVLSLFFIFSYIGALGFTMKDLVSTEPIFSEGDPFVGDDFTVTMFGVGDQRKYVLEKTFYDINAIEVFVKSNIRQASYDLILEHENHELVAFFNQPAANNRLHFYSANKTLETFDSEVFPGVWYLWRFERVDLWHFNIFLFDENRVLIESHLNVKSNQPWRESVKVQLYHMDDWVGYKTQVFWRGFVVEEGGLI